MDEIVQKQTADLQAELEALRQQVESYENQGLNRAKIKMSTLDVEEDDREPIDIFLDEVSDFATKYEWDFSAMEDDFWDFKLIRGNTTLMLKMDFDVQEFYRGQVITEMDNANSLFRAMTQLGKPQ